MSKTREALEAALNAYKSWLPRTAYGVVDSRDMDQARDRKLLLGAISKIEAALAVPEQEPVGCVAAKLLPLTSQPYVVPLLPCSYSNYNPKGMFVDLYTSPQPREWQELSETELHNLTTNVYLDYAVDEAMAWIRNVYPVISAALRAKNGMDAGHTMQIKTSPSPA